MDIKTYDLIIKYENKAYQPSGKRKLRLWSRVFYNTAGDI